MKGFVLVLIMSLALIGASFGQEVITADDIIAGSMDIEFNTRINLDASGDLVAGSPALGAKDVYKFSFTVAQTTQFSGEITRQPNLYSSLIRRHKQEAALTYAIDLSVLNPKDTKQRKAVGKWVGFVPVDTATGAFNLNGSADRPLRIQVDAIGKASAFASSFTGRLIGKAEQKSNLASYTFSRLVGGRKIEVVVKQSDPMRFENLALAQGPAASYPTATVNGRLDYDYETGNWMTDGIRFHYSLDGREIDDTVTGTIKWVEDENRETNGKGYYEFNLRFNEAQQSGEAAAFEGSSDEDAFFAVDTNTSCLTGRVSYADTFTSLAGEPVVSASKVTYNLSANRLTKVQVMNFFKLWLIGTGPLNDE